MKRIVTIFGLILGAILAANTVYMMSRVCANPDFETNDVLGYAAMVIVFSLTFFGIRNYRNKQLNGFISLGKAFKTGALIALIGATVYVIVGLTYYYVFAPNFLDQYAQHVLHQASRHGATAAELAEKTQELAQFKEMYKNPLFAVLISYMEVLPIGLVVAFVSALILKRKSAKTPYPG
jgi:ethanolamine transporter EutH